MSKVFIVAFNDDEYTDSAHLHQVLEPQDRAFKEKVFTPFEKAVAYAEKWATTAREKRSMDRGQFGVTIFQAEMDEEP